MLERLQSWNNHGFTIVLFPSNNYFIFLLIDGSLKDLPNGKTRLVVKKVKNLSNCITFEMIKNNFQNFVRYNLNYIFIKKLNILSQLKTPVFFRIQNPLLSVTIIYRSKIFHSLPTISSHPNNPFSFSQSQK